MRVLVTRPADDAAPLARALKARGIDSLIEPLLAVADVPDPAPDLAGVQALLVTSANGVRAFARKCADRCLPVLAVGDASAAAARAAGFADVRSAAGDVLALAALAIAECDPADGALLHVAASDIAGDLEGALVRAGFDYRRRVLYKARQAEIFSADARAALAGGALDGVLLFSPRTGKAFAALADKSGVAEACRRMTAYCLSPAVAEAVAGLPWRAVVVAGAPDQDSLIDAVVAGATSR